MRALVLEKPYTLTIKDEPKPVPAVGEALVRVLSVGICGSEIHAYHGKHAKRVPPVIMGHEVCCVVEGLATDTAGPAPGTRVVVLPMRACGTCHWCKHGHPNLCTARVMLGETTWAGGFAEYFTVPARLLYPIADELGDDEATLVEPLAVGVHAVREAGIEIGDNVLVMGAGAIGLMTVFAARQAGAAAIVATDLFDYNLEIARELGATHCVNARRSDPVELVREISGGFGVDAAFLAVDAPGLFDQAVKTIRKRGSIILIAIFTEPHTIDLQAFRAVENIVRGSVTYTPEDFAVAIKILQRHRSQLGACITRQFSLEEAAGAFEIIDKHNDDLVRAVIKYRSLGRDN